MWYLSFLRSQEDHRGDDHDDDKSLTVVFQTQRLWRLLANLYYKPFSFNPPFPEVSSSISAIVVSLSLLLRRYLYLEGS
jgi:hypothetical protein